MSPSPINENSQGFPEAHRLRWVGHSRTGKPEVLCPRHKAVACPTCRVGRREASGFGTSMPELLQRRFPWFEANLVFEIVG